MDGPEARERLTVEERASRRDRFGHPSGDRYAALLDVLRAGRAVDDRERRGVRLEWHPIARRLLVLALIAVLLYVVVSSGVRFVRESQVDTWDGPGNTVTSGQQLKGCQAVEGYDPTFPRWIRFGSKVFVSQGLFRPVGYGVNPSFPETGYSLGNLRLEQILNTPEGNAGEEVLVRIVDVPAGQVYAHDASCQ